MPRAIVSAGLVWLATVLLSWRSLTKIHLDVDEVAVGLAALLVGVAVLRGEGTDDPGSPGLPQRLLAWLRADRK